MTQAIVRRVNDYDGGDDGAVVPFDAYSATEMAVRLEDLASRLGVVQEFFNRVMVKDQDYGVIPGTDKPALLKPGAEKLCELYGYAPMVKHVDEERDIQTGFYHCRVTVALVSKKTGESVAEGTGSANTHESRYRWRWVWADKVPAGLDKAHLTSRTVGRNNSTQYRLENDDPWSLWNTVLKMAKKRALVDVTLSATRSSGLFTQDAEAFEDYVEGGAEPKAPIKTPQRKSRAEAARVDTSTGEVIGPEVERGGAPAGNAQDRAPSVDLKELAALLSDAALSMHDLEPQLGPVTRETARNAITAWLIANPGKTVRDLVAGAVPSEEPSEQGALV